MALPLVATYLNFVHDSANSSDHSRFHPWNTGWSVVTSKHRTSHFVRGLLFKLSPFWCWCITWMHQAVDRLRSSSYEDLCWGLSLQQHLIWCCSVY
ncbi:unnamed protein product, partial [Schistosoma curassoni]